MSKISTYPSADTPLLLSDRLIGTEAIRTPPSKTPLATKNFSLGELLELFSSNFPAASLQAVLNTGNTATQNITLIGTIDATLIKPVNIEDPTGSQGTVFQYLSKGASSINWVDLPVSTLQAVLDAGNIATQNINLVGNITTTKIIPGNIQDDTSGVGTTGQVLSKTATGIRWINNPIIYTAGLADVLSVGNTATNNIILNGYIKPIDIKDSTDSNGSLNQVLSIGAGGLEWITNSASTVTSLTVTGNSGPSTLIAGVLNIPTYTLSGLGGQPLSTNLTSLSGLTYSSLGFVKMSASGTFTLDTSTYLIGITSSDVTTALGYTPVTNARTLTINGVTYDLTADRSWTIATGSGTVTSVGLTVPTAFNVTPSTITSSGTFVITGAGTTAQYVKGDGTLGTTVTKTSELFNDGDNGTSHFISLQDLPSNLTLYATDVASGISTYTKAVSSLTDPDYNTTAVNIPTGALTSTTVPKYCGGVISSANIIIGNPGIFTMSTIGNIRRTAGTAEGIFYYEIYKRTSAGVETLIVTSANSTPVSSAIYVEFNAAALFNNGVFLDTDRVVIKFYGLRLTGGSDPSFDFQFGGSNPVRTTLPIPLVVTPANGVTSVSALTLTSIAATDLSSTVANPTTTPVITLNVPDAGPTARGVITTLAQTINGAKTFIEGITTNGITITNLGSTNGNLAVISNDFYYTVASGRTHYFGGTPGNVANNLSVPLGTLNLGLQTASTIASFDASKNIVSLPLATYPSLDELKTVRGITTGVTIQSQIDSKQNLAVAASGAVISFVTPQIYNSVASPATGNITDNGLTGAKIGVVQKIYHQSGTAPTFGAGGWKKLGTGTYSTTLLNIIYCEWVSGARVEYWIVQSEA